jgi:4-amino-4-deoxy-L-arabinose transferase-like glycosyltransferase
LADALSDQRSLTGIQPAAAGGASRRLRWARVGEAGLTGVAAALFVAVTAWWLSRDTSVQDWDNALHTLYAFVAHDQIAAGALTAPLRNWNTYPPLVHLVGALGVFVGGRSPASVIMASNLVFVPLLAFGCYGVGRLAYGPGAGILAALFALGTPMVISEMHEFLLDPPQAAMIAVTVWALLASRRFERPGLAALAGVLTALAMLAKETSVVFLAGLLLVVIVRGGWRHWRGLACYASGVAVFALPWYAYHADQLRAQLVLHGAEANTAEANPLGGAYPSLVSAKNALWYFWDAANIQLRLPLLILFLLGVALAIRGLARRRPASLTPELLGGALVAWLGMTVLTHKDPRYTLPGLVYAAVLATGWIVTAPPWVRRSASVGLLAVVAANFAGVAFGVGHVVRVALPGARDTSPLAARYLTLYSPDGWLRGAPRHDGDVLALMRGLRRAGVSVVYWDGGSTNAADFNQSGLSVMAVEVGLRLPVPLDPAALGPHDAFLLRRAPQPGDPPPCQRLLDGSGVYVELGNPLKPFDLYKFICPTRSPAIYARTTPLPAAEAALGVQRIRGAPRTLLLSVMRALRRQGVRLVEFDAGSVNVPFFAPIGLRRLAVASGLGVPATYAPQALGPRDAFMLRHAASRVDPPPCGRFPDGTGLYIVLGNPVIPFTAYRLYCPLRTPRFYAARPSG